MSFSALSPVSSFQDETARSSCTSRGTRPVLMLSRVHCCTCEGSWCMRCTVAASYTSSSRGRLKRLHLLRGPVVANGAERGTRPRHRRRGGRPTRERRASPAAGRTRGELTGEDRAAAAAPRRRRRPEHRDVSRREDEDAIRGDRPGPARVGVPGPRTIERVRGRSVGGWRETKKRSSELRSPTHSIYTFCEVSSLSCRENPDVEAWLPVCEKCSGRARVVASRFLLPHLSHLLSHTSATRWSCP